MVNSCRSTTVFVLAAVTVSVRWQRLLHQSTGIIITSEGIKPIQVKHLFSEVKGQGVLKDVKTLITQTPRTHFPRLGKRIAWVYWGGFVEYSEFNFFCRSCAGFTMASEAI